VFVSGCFGLFRTVCFGCFASIGTKTENFDVSIEPKQTEYQPKPFDREHILVFYRKFWVVWVCFETILFVFDVSIYRQIT
jgi:hypothetical protein